MKLMCKKGYRDSVPRSCFILSPFSPSECRRYDFSSILRIIVKILRVIQNERGYFDLINFFIIWVFFSFHIFILNVI